MLKLSRLFIAAALLGSIAFVGLAADSANAAPKATCTGSAGTVKVSPGLQWEQNQGESGTYSSSGLACTGPIAAAGDLTASFGGMYGNCKNIRGDTSTARQLTVKWTDPADLGSSTGLARLTVASTTGHTTTFSVAGTFNQTQGMLYRGQHFSGTITTDKGLNSVPAGDCTVTTKLSSFGITAISFTVGS
jgi:hypothetical protein